MKALCVGLLWCWKWVCTVFTTVGTPTVSLPVICGGTTDEGLLRELQQGKRDIIIICTFCNPQLWLTSPPGSTCLLEYPQAKDPVKCQAKKKLQLSVHRLPVSDLYFCRYFTVCKYSFCQEAVVLCLLPGEATEMYVWWNWFPLYVQFACSPQLHEAFYQALELLRSCNWKHRIVHHCGCVSKRS